MDLDLNGARVVKEGMNYPHFWLEFDNGIRLSWTVDRTAAPHDCFFECIGDDPKRPAGPLRTNWSVENAQSLRNLWKCADLGVHYDHVARVLWWQFWRWPLCWRRDYVLSRAGDIVLIERCAAELKRQVDETARKKAQGVCQAVGCEQPTGSSWDDRCMTHSLHVDGGRP